jgi:hypothetical protein
VGEEEDEEEEEEAESVGERLEETKSERVRQGFMRTSLPSSPGSAQPSLSRAPSHGESAAGLCGDFLGRRGKKTVETNNK